MFSVLALAFGLVMKVLALILQLFHKPSSLAAYIKQPKHMMSKRHKGMSRTGKTVKLDAKGRRALVNSWFAGW